MSSRPDENALLRGYLLSTMPEEERLDFAARYFSDDELFERLQAAEADLIDEYVRGELSPEERRAFEDSLPKFAGRSERVAFARALERLPAGAELPKPSGPRGVWGGRSGWLAAAALVLLALGTFWIVQGDRRELSLLRTELDRLEGEQRRLREENRELRGRLETLGGSETPGGGPSLRRVVSLVLSAGIQREGGAANRLEIPETAEVVRLTLPFPVHSGTRYRVRIERPDGAEVTRLEEPSVVRNPDGRGVTIELSAASLPGGDYVILVEGVSKAAPEPVQEYVLRVVRP